MRARVAIAVAGLIAAGPALTEPLNPETARTFIAGHQFAFNCFDGTRGTGRIYGDGSVAGSIQIRGSGPVRYVALPAGTLRVKGQAYCASLRGLPIEPCFNLNRTTEASFRGSLSGLGFAYCDFTRRPNPAPTVRMTWRLRPAMPMPLEAAADDAPAQ